MSSPLSWWDVGCSGFVHRFLHGSQSWYTDCSFVWVTFVLTLGTRFKAEVFSPVEEAQTLFFSALCERSSHSLCRFEQILKKTHTTAFRSSSANLCFGFGFLDQLSLSWPQTGVLHFARLSSGAEGLEGARGMAAERPCP